MTCQLATCAARREIEIPGSRHVAASAPTRNPQPAFASLGTQAPLRVTPARREVMVQRHDGARPRAEPFNKARRSVRRSACDRLLSAWSFQERWNQEVPDDEALLSRSAIRSHDQDVLRDRVPVDNLIVRQRLVQNSFLPGTIQNIAPKGELNALDRGEHRRSPI